MMTMMHLVLLLFGETEEQSPVSVRTRTIVDCTHTHVHSYCVEAKKIKHLQHLDPFFVTNFI